MQKDTLHEDNVVNLITLTLDTCYGPILMAYIHLIPDTSVTLLTLNLSWSQE